MRYYNLRFIKGGMDEINHQTCHSEAQAFEVIRDRLGMGWLLVSIEVQ